MSKNKNKRKRKGSVRNKSITLSDVQSNFQESRFSNYRRFNTEATLAKLGGYQYFSADVVAKTIASQKLRLYASESVSVSKYTSNREKIYVKNVPIDSYRKDYLKGNHEVSHDKIRYKSLHAEKDIIEILDHPALELIRDQNPYSNQWTFLYTLALSMQFYGNSYFQKVRDGSGMPIELWLAPAQYMEIIQGATTDDFINHYLWGQAVGQPRSIDPVDILDFKMPGVGNSQVYGTSKIEVTWKYLGLMDSSLAFQKSICDNTGRPDFLLIAEDAKNNADDLKRMERKWNDRFYGPDQAGKMSTIPGKVKVEILPRSEFDFETDSALIRAISRGFGLPEYKMMGSSAIKANDSTQEKDFMKETIDSYLTLIENVLNENLLSDYQRSENLFFAFDPVIREDQEFKHKQQIAFTDNGIWTINQVRSQLGDEPEEGGDVLRYKGKDLTVDESLGDISDINFNNNSDSDNDKALKESISKILEKIDRPVEIKQAPAPVLPDINVNVFNGNETEEILEEKDISEIKEGESEESQNIEQMSVVDRITEKLETLNKDQYE